MIIGRVCDTCDFYVTDDNDLSRSERRQANLYIDIKLSCGPGGWCTRSFSINFVKSNHHCEGWTNLNQRIANKSW